MRGIVWAGENGDGTRGALEPGVALVHVDLFDSSGAWIDTTTTDASGQYTLEAVALGQHYVVFAAPEDTAFTIPNVGSDTLDSDADMQGITAVFTVSSGETFMDAGLVTSPWGSVGDRVWDDRDGDGVQDAGEPGSEGVAVYLFEGDGTFVDVTATDASGSYLFPSVRPADYYLVFEKPVGYTGFSPQNVGDDQLDSDVDSTGRTATFTVGVGQSNLTLDAGLVPVPEASVGDLVWDDLDHDGTQDLNEPGLADVPVSLYSSGGALVGSTTTDVEGFYAFSSVVPGTYYLVFSTPAGYSFSPKDQGGNDALDSDPDSKTGQTSNFTLGAGENRTDIDAGVFVTSPGSIADRVWRDNNQNGIQDTGEPGLSGVTVKLLDGSGQHLQTKVTDGSGNYAFSGLVAGSKYQVEFVPLSGYQFSPKDQGKNDALDSDANPTTGRTDFLSLAAGQNRTDVDGGLFQVGALGAPVWQDLDGGGTQDAGEQGMAGVSVEPFRADGTRLATALTADGSHPPTGLARGGYSVSFRKPAGPEDDCTFRPQDEGTEDTADRDASDFGFISRFALLAGEDEDDLEATLTPALV